MCGIFGYFSFDDKKVNCARFEQSLQTIVHRGPNFQKSLFLEDDSIALGHVRLSIIDLTDEANQPMAVDKYQVIYNGEIYNYIELKNELSEKGYTFNTRSDTEVLVKAYDCWGEDCVCKFNGMWAFAIYDTVDKTIFCSRDRFGVKPFNYYLDDDKFIFSSEIKAILAYDSNFRKPNYNSIAVYCRETGGSSHETWFENINRLLPGHNLVVKQNKVSIYRYYHYQNKQRDISLDEAKKEFQEIFIDATKLRMRSDVPVGVTLSGGHDSTSVVASVRQFNNDPINSYTAQFPGFKNDEFSTAEKTNQHYKLDGNPVVIDLEKDYVASLSKIIYHLESGHSSDAIMPLWRIYDQAKKKVTVVLEGQGADELLAGYIHAFAPFYLLEKLKKFQFGLFFKSLKQLSKNYSVKTMMLMCLRLMLPTYLRSLVRVVFIKNEGILEGKLRDFEYRHKPKCDSESVLLRELQRSHQMGLVNLLHYGDAISMAFSLESRLPFMDYRLVEFAMSLPEDYFIANGKGKYIQREALKHILPDYINDEHKKLGFPTPTNKFFAENKEMLKEILLDERTKKRNIFNMKKLEKYIHSDLDNALNRGGFLFRVLSVELWFRLFIDEKNSA